MRKIKAVMFAAAIQSLAAITNGQGSEMTTAVMPTADGHGVAACVSVGFGDLRELPLSAVRGLWSLIVCVTQPIHPYHYVRDDQGAIMRGREGDKKKVWLPFYRLWGEYQGDGVVGIVYDNRSTNGLAGGHWFAGYANSGWQDKGGKMAGLALLAWGTSQAMDSGRSDSHDSDHDLIGSPIVHPRVASGPVIQEQPTETSVTPNTEPEPPVWPDWPAEWEGEGCSVGI